MPIAASQQKLLAAARKVFARDGISGATTREIARVAGVNEVTLFRNFASKDNLLIATIRDLVETQRALLDGVQIDSVDVERGLTQLAELYIKKFREHEQLGRTLLSEAHRLSEATRQAIREMERPMDCVLRQYLRDAQERGALRPFAVDPAADALVAMIASVCWRGALRHLSYENEEYVKQCVEIFLRGTRC